MRVSAGVEKAARLLEPHSDVAKIEIRPPDLLVVTLKKGVHDYSFLPSLLIENGLRLLLFREEELNLETAFMRMRKAKTGNVTIEPLAVFTGDGASGTSVSIGWAHAGTTAQNVPLFTVPNSTSCGSADVEVDTFVLVQGNTTAPGTPLVTVLQDAGFTVLVP